LLPLKNTDYNTKGDFVGDDRFSTRYFITTNGLPIKKGENYIQWNLYGPDVQFGIKDNLGIGVMTSWIGMPIIGTLKYSFQATEKVHFAIGSLIGTGSWALPESALAVPFATTSFGDRQANIAMSGGYGWVALEGDSQGRFITSVAGMVKVNDRFSLVFDSFILLPSSYKQQSFNILDYSSGTTPSYYQMSYSYSDKPMMGIIIPGVRLHTGHRKAFQFGFAGVFTGPNYKNVIYSPDAPEYRSNYETEFLFAPVPMVQWFRSF